MKYSFFLLLGTLFSCTSSHFISDETERESICRDFESKKQEISNDSLFEIFNTDLNTEEKEALTFLYAYLPIGDISDYSGAFYLDNIRSSLQARREMPWANQIPEREFRHFVLPIRVNNENLDHSRRIFYAELKDRVKNLSLYDAVLEVNHWCHEKVIYTPSDARTSSPLASVKTAYGRCGEESTFLVAALRSVGIPARQVYTPRWAHTDDNHAWVEAWVEGKWHFLGACEPEPILDLAWFNAPASRGMLMHTKVFGRYNGPEEIMLQTPGYTEINVIDNYAPTSKARIIVTDRNNRPVEGAKVEFKIYNYAEFYTVASRLTDSTGTTTLTAGKGDMLVWASKDGRFGYQKLPFTKDSTLSISLDKKTGKTYSLPLDIIPPSENSRLPEVDPEQRTANDCLLAQEDSIRNAYVSTFITARQAGKIAQTLSLDSNVLTPLLIGSRGNHEEILTFLKNTPEKERPLAIRLLQVISAKDLRDTPAEILTDHLHSTPRSDNPLFEQYILNPRIANELLSPYKSFFRQAIPTELAEQIQSDPGLWIQWCAENVRVKNNLNSQRIPISPAGVWKARIADEYSRNSFFVAVLRTFGIPARIDDVTGKTQYANTAGEWIDVNFTAQSQAKAPQGKLHVTYSPVKALPDPQYYSHYTLSRFENGSFHLLNFPENTSSSWKNLLSRSLPLDTGYYLLVSGTRLANGSVLTNLSFFNVRENQQTTTELVMRENPDEVKVIGNIDSEAKFLAHGKTEPQSILQTTGRGYFIVAILGTGQEPTNHALRDIAALKKDFETWGRQMVFLFPTEQQLQKFNPEEFPELPDNITFGIDENNRIRHMIMENLNLNSRDLPIFVIGDTFNRVVFISQGYTIGLGEQLMKTIHKL